MNIVSEADMPVPGNCNRVCGAKEILVDAEDHLCIVGFSMALCRYPANHEGGCEQWGMVL